MIAHVAGLPIEEVASLGPAFVLALSVAVRILKGKLTQRATPQYGASEWDGDGWRWSPPHWSRPPHRPTPRR